MEYSPLHTDFLVTDSQTHLTEEDSENRTINVQELRKMEKKIDDLKEKLRNKNEQIASDSVIIAAATQIVY